MEKVRWVELALLVLAASFMFFAIMINGVKVNANVVKENVNLEADDFIIKDFGYNFGENFITFDYSVGELAGVDQDLTIVYGVRDYSGNKIAEGRQQVVLGAGQEGKYKARLDLPADAKGFLRLSFTVWNGKDSRWIVREIGKEGASITGMAVSEKVDAAGSWVLSLLILTFITLGVILYLRKHHLRVAKKFYEKRKLIPFEV